MNALENYKSNVDLVDIYGIKNDLVGRNMLCRLRHIEVINRRKEGAEERKEICRPLAAAVFGVNNTGISQYSEVPRVPEATSTWTNIDEQKLYLDTKPNCYVIISKPGAGAYSLGEEMAKILKCIHICPRNVIIDEIEQSGLTGACVDFNMKHFRECKVNSIMPIIKQKLHSPAVQHRGYILSGLPLVSCTRTEFSFFKKMYSEDAVDIVTYFLNDLILNLKKKKKMPKSGTTSTTSVSSGPGEIIPEETQEEEQEVEPEGEEEEDVVVELPKYVMEPCKSVIFPGKNYYDSKKLQLLQQINHLFKLDLKPDVFIYITCADEDLVGKRHRKHLNYKDNICVINPHIQPQRNEIRWPEKYSLRDFQTQYDANDVNFKYAVRHPLNFTKHSTVQLCNYRNHVLPFWEKKIIDTNPKFIIKVDGRTSVQEMSHHICERLDMLPIIKPVLIPEPVNFDEPIEDLDEFWKIVESTKIIQNSELNFNRYASPWYNRCPVELKKRHCVRGKSKYALALFNHVFLLSSLENFTAFYKNPRTYLDYYMIEPPCRFIVMGTKSSGKSMIAECLSWLFDSNIISYDTIYNNEKQKKYEMQAKVILEEIIVNIEEARYDKWQSAENDRLSSLETWQNSALASLKKYTFLLGEYLKILKEDGDTQTERFTKIDKSLNNVKKQVNFLPFLEDLDQCKNALSSKNITQYAPANLTIMLEKPKVPLLGDPDVNEAILEYIDANNLQNEIDPTPQEIMNVILEILRSLDSESLEAYSCYGKFVIDGFPPDNEHWSYLTESNLLPDYTIAIIENREINSDLIHNYIQLQNTFKRHQERFILANDPLIKIKLELLKGLGKTDSHLNNVDQNVQKIVHDSINSTIGYLGIPEEDIEQYENEQIISYNQANEKFREDWEGIKLKLEDNFKSFVEVEIDIKSDIEVLEDVLLQLRKCYYVTCELYESDENDAPEESEEDIPKDFLIFNDPRFLCETGIFCPISFFEQGVLWEGKSEFSVKLLNKIHYFAKEECLELFRKDPTKYQSYNIPFKKIPPWRICVTGCVGSGKTRVSRYIGKELGLIHVDFEDAVNKFILPKHFKKVGRKYENIFVDMPVDEEGVVEFQMAEDNENFISDITFNETELRRMIYNYFERGTPMFSVLIQKILKKLWFEEPFASTGFILDGFPRNPNDVEDMVAYFSIPDLILELESSSDVALERVVPEMFKTWKTQQKEAKAKAQIIFNRRKEKWLEFVTKEVVVKVVIDDILNEVMSIVEVEPPPVGSNLSTVIDADADPSGSPDFNSVYDTYMEIIEQNPAPVDESVWEKADEARERLEGRIEAIYESDEENIQAFRDILAEHKMKYESVDATARRVPVPDERFDYLVEYHKPVSKVPAFLNVVDIAGLVRGAAEGQGLGNAFLSHIKACDAIFNLCRAFDDEDVIHVDGDVNPVRDLETIGEELRLKDEEQLMQHIDKLDRVVNRGGDKKLKPEYDTLSKIKTVLVDEKKHIRFADWSAADIEVLNKYLFLTSKPALYLVNLSEKDYIRKKNKWLPKLKEWIDKNDPGAPLIPFSGVLESKLMDMDPEEKKAFLKEHGITSALDKIIVQGYKALQLEYFFTAGPDEVKAWTIQKGTKAPQAAGRIHTDFEKGFIMAEVMHYKDFKEEGTEAACKAAGKYRQQGRNYVVEDGDIIFFKFNAGAGLKDAKKK